MKVDSRHVDSDLGSWTHAEWRPAPNHPLAGVVEAVWDFEGRTNHPRERVFPTGGVELIVQLGDRYRDVDGGSTRLTPPSCVTGIQTGPMVIEAPPGGCRVLGIRLHPPGAWSVLDHPLSELTDVTADLRDLLGSAACELADRCADAGTPTERVRRAVDWLGGQARDSSRAPHSSRAVCWVASRIAGAGGAVRIGPLRAETGLSTGRLAAGFLEQVGVTPKRYARIQRFRRALHLLHGRAPNLAGIAHRAGYYDQPHMNAEFRELAGLTPGQLLAARSYPASTSLVEP